MLCNKTHVFTALVRIFFFKLKLFHVSAEIFKFKIWTVPVVLYNSGLTLFLL